jgi:dihydroorotate dehydrogenase electron transfer subunit
MLQIKVKLIKNKRVKENYYHCVLSAPAIAKSALPGQFVSIKVSDTEAPLLRRPFSIHRKIGGKIEILYEAVGTGTEIFAQRKPGEYLDVVGPLGNGFDYRAMKGEQQTKILVAGGMGVAPLVFLAEKLKETKALVLIGAKNKKHINCEKEFKDLGCEVKIATDDGSLGFHGKVTELCEEILLNRFLESIDSTTLFACGPRPMLKAVSVLSKKYNLPAQISLEEHMACGIGACLGCVVNTADGFKRVCKDGPVFLADDIIW